MEKFSPTFCVLQYIWLVICFEPISMHFYSINCLPPCVCWVICNVNRSIYRVQSLELFALFVPFNRIKVTDSSLTLREEHLRLPCNQIDAFILTESYCFN
jgi:hypothetical protein